LLIDSDADFGPEILEEFRTLTDGWEYDIFQAFYTRRGWPPEAIWFKEDALGNSMQAFVLGEGTEPTTMVGFHFTLIRREVIKRIWKEQGEGKIDPDEFDWAWYPRHSSYVEDAAFCKEAQKYGFRIGSTSVVKTGHNVRVTTGWETYLQFLEISGQLDRLDRYNEGIELVAEFLGEEPGMVRALSMRGSENIRKGLEGYLFGKEIESFEDLSAEDLREFYGWESAGYFYDLLGWNSTPLYDLSLDPLRGIEGEIILVVGAGLGGEVEAAREKNAVVVFELPGKLREFLQWRYEEIDAVQVYTQPSDLREIIAPEEGLRYGVVVAVDTVEHFHPDDFEPTLDKMLELTKPGGLLYFRSNFGDPDLYPVHFDHSEAFEKWTEKNDLELYAGYEKSGVEIYRRRIVDEEIKSNK
jgi:SAM-dependent methyltransferase